VEHSQVIPDRREEFVVFSEQAALRLRPALVAHHGVATANDLCADAIAYAWENWDRVRDLDNPVGYLYRVATSRARRYRRWRRPVVLPAESGIAAVESDNALHVMLAKLPLGQRTAVVLVHVYGWSYQDVAEVEPSATTVVTGMRVPAMHGTPPITWWSIEIRSKRTP
jgi:DNA-directed RNA polymerase specialized sigma24 family protein